MKRSSYVDGTTRYGPWTEYGRGYQGRAMIWRSPMLRWTKPTTLAVVFKPFGTITIGGRMGYKKKRKKGKGSR